MYIGTYKIRTFIQTPAQNQDEDNFMRSAVIYFVEKISVGIILFGCASRFDLFSNKLLVLVGLKHICKLRQYTIILYRVIPLKVFTNFPHFLQEGLCFQYVQIDFHTIIYREDWLCAELYYY